MTSAPPGDYAQSFLQTWGALLALCLTMFIVVLDTSMMNVAVPQITKDLSTTVPAVQAVIAIYSLTMASLMLVGAKLGTIYGSKRILTIALYVYGLGTLIATFAWDIVALGLGWSIIEGIAAAALIPLTMSLVLVNYSGVRRALAFGVLGGFQATAAAIGPIFGGFITEFLSWRVGFAFEVVIVIVVLFFLKYIREGERVRTQTLDVAGTVLSVAGLVSIVLGSLLAGRYGWWQARRPFMVGDIEINPFGLSITPVLIALGVGLLVAFAHWSLRREEHGETPLVRIGILSNGTFVTGFSTDALQSVTLAGVLFVFPLFLQQVLGQTPLQAGITLLPLSVSVLAVSLFTPGWGRYVYPKYLVMIGAAMMGAGIFWSLLVVAPGMSGWDFALPLLVFGAGTGLLLAQVPNLTMSSVDPTEGAEASGVQNATKELGTSIGTAVIGSVFLVSFLSGVATSLVHETGQQIGGADRGQIVVEFEDLLDRLSADQQNKLYQTIDAEVGGRLGSIVSNAQADAMIEALAAVGIFVLLAFLFASFLPRGKLAESEEKVDDEHPFTRRAATPERGT